MPKKSKIEKNKRILQKILALKEKRSNIKHEIRKNKENKKLVFDLYLSLNKLAKNSAPTRFNTRCNVTGRSKSVYKTFGISRIKLRELSAFGHIPGVRKSSW